MSRIKKLAEESDQVIIRNYVAKNMEKFNRPATHEDKKRAEKSGKAKHKRRLTDEG